MQEKESLENRISISNVYKIQGCTLEIENIFKNVLSLAAAHNRSSLDRHALCNY